MNIKSILEQNGFRFNKGYGQNFLTDDNVLSSIVASSQITDEDTVIEVGCGAGTLTRHIASVAKKVVGFEIDNNLNKVLDITLADCNNVQIIFDDIMKLSMHDIHQYVGNAPYKLVANIPYYITSPLIMKFIENSQLIDSMTLTIQKEVADRLCAKSGSDYGAITVAIDIVAQCSMQQYLPRQLFYPQPNVDSAVVRIDVNRNKYDIVDMALLKKLIKCAFAMRRKTLTNNLMSSFGYNRSQCQQLLDAVGINIQARGETLTTDQFVQLANTMAKYGQ